MDVRVVTLRYQDGQQGFPEGALRQATAGREVLEAREHFFTHGNVPHLAVVLLLGDGPSEARYPRDPSAPDPESSLPEERRGLYRDLRRWRNERAKADGKPAYAVARNAQLAEIVIRAPKTLAELKEVAGIGEAFCRDYGAAVLDRVGALSATATGEAAAQAEQQV
jgi:ATP-dependent DNA helicase RecQ